jgi:C4-dicarboxylate-specific signal transduction histidine kinase
MDNDWESIDLNWTISQRLQAAAERLTSGDIQIDLDLNLKVPKLFANRESLSQVFDYLLNYSASAFDRLDDDRERKIRISTRLHNKNELEVIYVDNAGGIPEEIRRNMAQPLHPAELEKGAAGVWIKKVVSIVSEHRGTVGLETADDTGSTFTLRFPLSSD